MFKSLKTNLLGLIYFGKFCCLGGFCFLFVAFCLFCVLFGFIFACVIVVFFLFSSLSNSALGAVSQRLYNRTNINLFLLHYRRGKRNPNVSNFHS